MFMPSLILHSIAGKELLKKFDVSKKQEYSFLVGNMFPDAVDELKNVDLDETTKRAIKQERKRITHFRLKKCMLEYPNLDFFLSIYADNIRTNICDLGYFFHLYVDYMYFCYYLPGKVCFLDDDFRGIDDRSKEKYVYISKSDTYIDSKSFWNKDCELSLYRDYMKLNGFLINNYNLSLDDEEILKSIKNEEVISNVKEGDSSLMLDVYKSYMKSYNNCKNIRISDLNILDEQEMCDFISDVVDSFFEDYYCLLEEYVRVSKKMVLRK